VHSRACVSNVCTCARLSDYQPVAVQKIRLRVHFHAANREARPHRARLLERAHGHPLLLARSRSEAGLQDHVGVIFYNVFQQKNALEVLKIYT